MSDYPGEPSNGGLFGKYTEQVVFEQTTLARQAEYGQLGSNLHPKLTSALEQSGMSRLFLHQAEAIDAWAEGQDVGVFTGTNSGKSLCYILPMLQSSLTEPMAKFIAVFPTKALAQDQCRRINDLAGPLGITAATYDGDTPKSHRSKIRNEAQIIVTNPDMLHLAILPGHENWAKFFRYLKLIVLDEIHSYRGVFGSHVSGVVRRLSRLADWHGARPQFITCSATVGNQEELVTRLTGRKSTIISRDSAPKGQRTLVFLNPPKLNDQIRLSPNITASEAMASLIDAGVQTLTFNRSRIATELVLRYTRDRVATTDKKKVESYRAGYTPKERRQIESAIKKGDILGISATNALELGVDIGSLDAVVLNGYPGSIASFGQQMGRAGRGTRDGLAIFIPHDNPLDQHFAAHPETLINAASERVQLNPENPTILSQQLKCAAHERPIAPSELSAFGEKALDIVEGMDRRGELSFRQGRFYLPSLENPAASINLRGSGGKQVRLQLAGEELGFLEYTRALTQAHEGAIYLHRGEPYLVERFDIENLIAYVVPFTGNYYTQPIMSSFLEPGSPIRERAGTRCSVGLCECTVTDTVQGFRKKSFDGDTVLDTVDLDLPSTKFETLALRIDLPGLDPEGDVPAQLGAIHGLEHILPSLAPAFIGCDRNDLGSCWYSVFFETLAPAVFVFDRTPGGVGLTEALYERVEEILMAGKQRLGECECDSGCPSCILSYGCESNNDLLEKVGTHKLISLVLSNLKGIV